MDVINQVLNQLNPTNYNTPILGKIRKGFADSLGTPSYANPNLSPSQQGQDMVMQLGMGGGKLGPGNSRVIRDTIGRFARKASPVTNAMHPEDIKEVSPVLERFFMNSDNLNYSTGQGMKDKQLIDLLASHYIGKDFMKSQGKNTKNVAQELLNRLMLDRQGIGQ